MTVEILGTDLVLVTDEVAPQTDPEQLRELTDLHGVASFLAVGSFAEGPLFRVPNGPWSLILSLLDGERPSRHERQLCRDFIGYERAHGRKVALWVENDDLRASFVQEAKAATAMPRLEDRDVAPGGKACCFSGHQGGVCGDGLVAHATTVAAAQAIFDSGALLSKRGLIGSSSEALAKESGYGEPSEYFEYVMFWNGDCFGPEIVARVRALGRETLAGLTPQDMDKAPPGVRFFFDPNALMHHPGAAWDGAHTVKIRDRLELEPYLVAAVVPRSSSDGSEIKLDAPAPIEQRIAYLDPMSIFTMSAWSTAVAQRASDVRGSS